MKSLVSVIIPVYNCADYLLRCLESVCNQSYSYLEIICVNDGSTDESGIILNNFSMTDSRLKIIHQNNVGAAVARNVALALATGEYIIMIDADDYVEPRMIEKMISAVESTSADIVLCGLKYIDKKGKILESRPDMPSGLSGSVASDFFEHFNPGPVAKLYKTEIIKKYFISFPSGIVMGEDAVFNAIYWHYVKNVYVLKEALYIYDGRNTFSATFGFVSGKLPFSVYAQTVSLPCAIYDELNKRRDGIKTLSEWIPSLLKMQLIEHGWVMDVAFSDALVKEKLNKISKNCYKQLAQYLTLYCRIRVSVLYRVSWLKGRIMRMAGKVKRFVIGLLFYNK